MGKLIAQEKITEYWTVQIKFFLNALIRILTCQQNCILGL